ncbi:MAG: enoyl-CoA hydratase [Acidimicrobiales bacterium]|nr:enoyl-CoA hydratase [Acidimicrobiales bacterium]
MDAVRVDHDDRFATITLANPTRRNVLALDVLDALTDAFATVGRSEARGVILAAEGPVFSAGHDFADMVGADRATARALFRTCTDLMETVQGIGQPVIARVHALATAAGCQLVATCDLAVAAESAGFALPGGRGGLFCHTPAVAVARAVGQKRALEMALTGDVVDAATAADWGLVNRCVPDDELDAAVVDLLHRATRGGRWSKALGKQGFYEQVGRHQAEAYALTIETMAAATQTDDAREGIAAFLEKRPAEYP